MKKSIASSLRFLLLSLLVFGGLYTALVTGLGQLFFSQQANGSQVIVKGQTVGSKLIGQNFDQPSYFSGRPEKVSQLSPLSTEQEKKVANRTKQQLQENPTEKQVPNDLVTASASGVDPDISVAAAKFQVDRVAKERQTNPAKIHVIIEKNSQKDWLSQRRFVNVLALNLALDRIIPIK